MNADITFLSTLVVSCKSLRHRVFAEMGETAAFSTLLLRVVCLEVTPCVSCGVYHIIMTCLMCDTHQSYELRCI